MEDEDKFEEECICLDLGGGEGGISTAVMMFCFPGAL